MSRVFHFFSLTLLLLTFQPARAQFLRLGVSTGALMKEMEFSSEVFHKTNWDGWLVGPTLEINLPLGLKVDGSLQYAHTELVMDNQELDVNYFSIPVNVKYNFSALGLVGLFVSVGYQWDTCIKGESRDILSQTFSFNKQNRSVNIGGGIRFLNHVQIGVYYNIPQKKKEGNTTEFDYNTGTFKTKNNWKIAALFVF